MNAPESAMTRRGAIKRLGGAVMASSFLAASMPETAAASRAPSPKACQRATPDHYVRRGKASLYYEDVGHGPAVMTTHGVTENHLYWLLPGVVDALIDAGYRVVSTDLRAHGLTCVAGGRKGYDVDTMAGDIGAIADQLGLERFHLLTHATGGIVGLRYAMSHSDRLLSLMSTDTGSATASSDAIAQITDPDRTFPRLPPQPNGQAASFRGRTWDELIAESRAKAAQDPFLNRMDAAVRPEAAWAQYHALVRLGDPDTLADFMTVFYDDPNPYIARLRRIACPNLVLNGEHDVIFVKPSEQLARELPHVKHVVLPGRGHMTALEDPERTTAEILSFLATLR
jgi:pimeloyl-ACP methyl ester carboxylesterase